MQITLKPNKRYTAIEVCEIVIEILEDTIPYLLLNKREFSPADLYWIITDVLRYVNNMVDGEFKLRSAKKDNWEVVYIDEKTAKRQAKEEAKKQMKRAAKYIETITGNRPKWSS